MTEVDLGKILNVPGAERNITMEQIMAAGRVTNDDEGLNTAQDDTIDEEDGGPKSVRIWVLLEER